MFVALGVVAFVAIFVQVEFFTRVHTTQYYVIIIPLLVVITSTEGGSYLTASVCLFLCLPHS